MSKLRKLARDRECQVRIPGICNHNPETTVLAHLGGAGMGMKANDLHAAYCCSACHDAIDGRVKALDHYGSEYTRVELQLYHLYGVIRTQDILIDEGILKV